MAGEKKVGVAILKKCQETLMKLADKKKNDVTNEMDWEAIEKRAWSILGQEELYEKKLALTREIEGIERRLAEFDGGDMVCSRRDSYRYSNRRYHDKNTQLGMALCEAQDELYPEVAKLQRIRETIEERTVFCLLTEDLQSVVEQIKKEIEG